MTIWLDDTPSPPPMPRSPWKRITPKCNVKEGDIVRLISSVVTPPMTVTGTKDMSRPMFHCVAVMVCWFDSNHHIQTAEFRDILLEKLEPTT